MGYLRLATKVGIIVDDSTEPIQWQIQDAVGSVVLGGSTAVYGLDGASGDFLHHADFSPLSDLGTYKLVADSIGGSLEFHIAPTLYPDLPHEAINYFYFHRLGTVIEGRHLVDDRYARAALHPDDTSVPPYPGWCSTCDRFNVSGSWADAGTLLSRICVKHTYSLLINPCLFHPTRRLWCLHCKSCHFCLDAAKLARDVSDGLQGWRFEFARE